MKRSWIRKMAVILSICLILNSGLGDLAGYTYSAVVYAAENTDSKKETESASSDEEEKANEENAGKEDPAPEGGKEAGTVPESGPEEVSSESGTEGATETSTETSTEESTETSMEESMEESTEESTEEIAVSLYRDENTMVGVPDTLDAFLAQAVQSKTFYVYTETDLVNIQKLCEEDSLNGLSGYTFKISLPQDAPSGQQYWDTSQMNDFIGIGTSAHPFQGIMDAAFDYASSTTTTYLKLDRSLFCYMGEGAVFQNMKIVANGCASPIAENITGSVTLKNLDISGEIGTGSTTVPAGTIAGTIGSGAVVTLENVTSTANVTGSVAGGIAGMFYPTASVIWQDGYAIGSQDTPITVTGSYATGGLYGSVPGDLTVDLSIFEHIAVSVKPNDGFAGYLIGIVNGSAYDGAKITVTDEENTSGNPGLTVDIAALSGTSPTIGGLIGTCLDNAALALPGTEEEPFLMSGTIAAESGKAAGLLGEVKNCKMTIENVTIQDTMSISGSMVGGMVGNVENNSTRLIIKNAAVKGMLSSSGGTGGILAWVHGEAAVELQGKITVTDTLKGAGIGSIASAQDEYSLIYLHGIEGMQDGESQLTLPMSGDLPRYNEVYSYGGVFRNQDMGSGTLLIGDGTIDQVGVVNNTITGGKLGESGEMDAAADLETFAIANFTSGKFGLSCFDITTLAELLSAEYTLYNNADISYEKTGIVALNRNDKFEGKSEFAFSGKLKGTNENITITQNSDLNQARLGLFSGLTGTPEFENLIIQGEVIRASYTGGLAFWISGDGIRLKNVVMKKKLSRIGGSVAGFIVREVSNSSFTVQAENVTMAAVVDAENLSACSGFITELDNAQVELENIILGGSIKSSGSGTAGGFLGKSWTRTGGTVDGLTVLEGTEYDTNAVFGGLVHTVTNRTDGSKLKLKDVDLANLNVKMYGQGDCGLLVHDGKLLILETIDYSTKGVNITGAAADFDELVGINNIRNAGTYGVVSIHNTSQSFSGSAGYHYEDQATYTDNTPKGNPDTRYYYDVFQKIENEDGSARVIVEKNGNAVTIDSPEDYLIMDIVQCCDDPSGYGQLTNYFKKFFSDNSVPGNSCTYDLSGTLDLTGCSVYPIPRQYGVTVKGNNAKLIFAASGMEGWTLPNVDLNGQKYQHHQMHCGMFGDISGGGLTVEDLTLSGSIGNLGNQKSGALVAGTLKGDSKIQNIKLDALYISSFGKTPLLDTSPLLIGNISDFVADEGSTKKNETVTLDHIEMKNYDSNPYSDNQQAAASLIGQVGGSDAKGIAIQFTHMKLEEDLAASGKKIGKYLKYASYIYHYDYTDDAAINKGSGLYLFTEEDEQTGWVTYGAELDEETEYYDTVNKVIKEGTVPEEEWIPYVYKVKEIDVNPKSGDILKGCGTYEDPYIIESAKQFLTLYRYINEPEKEDSAEYQYQSFYTGWKVIKTGTDAAFCTTKHQAAVAAGAEGAVRTVVVDGTTYYFTGSEDARVFGEADFPTPDQLAQAYYQLDADIDLSGITKGTYAKIAQDFAGFGTLERPFTGVWYGKDPTDSSEIHTITLPDKKSDAVYQAYGLIQYAKGAVVKDLILDTSDDLEKMAHIDPGKGVAGSVFAYVVGGDNIIDHVTTKTRFITEDASTIGGYVGIVQKGGVILRNLTEDSLKDFRILYEWKNTKLNGECWCSIAGKVEDGFILCEGGENDKVLTLSHTVLQEYYNYKNHKEYGNEEVVSSAPAVSNYSIVNGSQLKQDAAQDGGIVITVTDTAGGTNEKEVTIKIPNAASLQVMAMAMNADALNACPANYQLYADKDMHWGYAEDSRSRKASYSDIGCSTQTNDYLSAVRYDNANGYTTSGYDGKYAYMFPYLYQYMGLSEDKYLGVTNIGTGSAYSVLNLAQPANQTIYHTTWELAKDGSYDLTVYKEAFQGIGALYYPSGYETYASTFRGSLLGNDSTVRYNITRKLYWDYKNSKSPSDSQHHAGLFNILAVGTNASLYNEKADFGTDTEKACYKIGDLSVKGDVTIVPKGENTVYFANYYVYFGGIAGRIHSGNYIFENISTPQNDPMQVKDTTFLSDTGGIVGRVSNASSLIWLRDCHFAGTESENMILHAQKHAGGLIGWCQGGIVKITDCSGEYLDIFSDKENAGGLLGHMAQQSGNIRNRLIVEGSTQLPEGEITDTSGLVCVKNSNITSWYQAGGMIGETRCNTQITNVYSEGNTVGSVKNMGGIVGELGNNQSAVSTITNAGVKNLTVDEKDLYMGDITGIGGIVGHSVHVTTIENARVWGENPLTSPCKVTGLNKSRTADAGVGGIIGAKTKTTLTMKDCSVKNAVITGGSVYVTNYPVNIGVGGLCGYNNSRITLAGSNTVTASRITTQLAAESANIALASGGCFGLVRGYIGAEDVDGIKDYYGGLMASGNAVTGKYAGGLIGRLDSNGEIRLKKSSVLSGSVISDDSAGGLIGYAKPSVNGFAFNRVNDVSTDSVNTVSDMKIKARAAGGAFGYINLASGPARCENIQIKGSEIIAVGTSGHSAGGFIGECFTNADKTFKIYSSSIENSVVAAELLEGETAPSNLAKYAAGGILGKMVTGSKDGSIRCDHVTVSTDNKIGVRTKDDTSDNAVKLVKKDKTLVDGVTLPSVSSLTASGTDPEEGTQSSPKVYDALESLASEYGYCVGTFVGSMESVNADFYLLDSKDAEKEFTIPVMEYNPPVTDVGINTAAMADPESDSYYRKGAHILYGAPVTERDSYKASDAFKNVSFMKAKVEEVNTDYMESADLGGLLRKYRFSREEVELFTDSYAENYTFPGSDEGISGILVYKPQNGTIQEVMEGLTDIMTGVAGASASDMKILSITAEQKLVKNGITTNGDSPGITAVVTDGEAVYTYVHEDGLTGADNALSYTELTYTYSYLDGHQKIFRLPVFVEDPVYYGVHMKIREGSVTSVEDIRENGLSASESGTQIVIANDSDYTLLMEYAYGGAREKMPAEVTMEKYFILKDANGIKTLTPGTQLRLIDVTHGNIPYYYTVTEGSSVTQLRFSDFKDAAGNPYRNQPIRNLPSEGEASWEDPDTKIYTDLSGHKLENTGVERYLLTVYNAETENAGYQIHTDLTPSILTEQGVEDAQASKTAKTQFSAFADHEEMPWFQVISVPGLKITFDKTDNKTDIDGTISREETLTVKASILLKGSDLYWEWTTKGSLLDSENNEKYLELAFYLRNEDGRVNLPDGTNVSYVKAWSESGEKTYSDNQVLVDNTIVYYYKDILEEKKKIDDLTSQNTGKNDITISVEFVLNFSGSDLTGFAGGSYDGWMELLRCEDSDHPMGSGNTLDTYHEALTAQTINNLGFAIKSKHLEQLAVNTYPAADEEGNVIDYQVMFDFSDIRKKISGAGKEAALEKWAGMDYEVTYQLYKKTGIGENTAYTIYDGSDITIKTLANAGTEDEVVTGTSTQGKLVKVYNFTVNEIEEETLMRDGRMYLATKDLTQTQENLTNYKIKATLRVREKSQSALDEEEETTDFFVFTVTKLKNDLAGS